MKDTDFFMAILVVTLFILLLLAGIALMFFVSARQRIRQEIMLSETKLAFEQELRKVETEVSEHIMGQFARELHDNIGQILSAIHFQIESEKVRHPELSEGYRPIETSLDDAIQQLRLLSRTLNGDFIGHAGLLSAIESEAGRIRRLNRLKVHYAPFEGTSNLDPNQELMVFRIFQEITQNALRHSGAGNLYITVRNAGNGFELELKDDGRGFDKEAVFGSGKASGLRNILKRASLAGLTCEIDSGNRIGTCFLVKKMAT